MPTSSKRTRTTRKAPRKAPKKKVVNKLLAPDAEAAEIVTYASRLAKEDGAANVQPQHLAAAVQSYFELQEPPRFGLVLFEGNSDEPVAQLAGNTIEELATQLLDLTLEEALSDGAADEDDEEDDDEDVEGHYVNDSA